MTSNWFFLRLKNCELVAGGVPIFFLGTGVIFFFELAAVK